MFNLSADETGMVIEILAFIVICVALYVAINDLKEAEDE